MNTFKTKPLSAFNQSWLSLCCLFIRQEIQFIIGREIFATNARMSNLKELNTSWKI